MTSISRHIGSFENTFFRPIKPTEKGAFLQSLEQYVLIARRKKSARLSPITIEVFRALIRLIDYKSGRLDPSITGLMRMTLRCRSSIVRALKQLRAHGFLNWIRRFSLSGPRYEQKTNAYILIIPASAANLSYLSIKKPADEIDRLRKKQTEIKQYDFYDSGAQDAFEKLEKAIKNIQNNNK